MEIGSTLVLLLFIAALLILGRVLSNGPGEKRKSRSAPLTEEWAELISAQTNNWRPGGSSAVFLPESCQKPIRFHCWGDFTHRLPPAGTHGKLVYQGGALYSFSWGDQTLDLQKLPEGQTPVRR